MFPTGRLFRRICLGLLVLWCSGFMVEAKSRDNILLFAANIKFQVPEGANHNTIRPKNHNTYVITFRQSYKFGQTNFSR